MKMNRILIAFIATTTLFLFGTSSEVYAQETTWVKDETNALTEETLNNITKLNEEVFTEYDIQPQIGVEILQELPEGYYDIDEYKADRFEELGIGSKEHDSGILYIIAIDDRAFALENGYGIEPIVRDVESQKVLDDTIEHMRNYSDTGEPEHLNNAVNQAVGTLTELLEKGNTGQLFEERAEEERLAEIEHQEMIDAMSKGLNFVVKGVAILGLAGIAYALVKFYTISKEKKRLAKKLSGEKEQTLKEFTELYENGGVPFADEYSLEDFKEYFTQLEGRYRTTSSTYQTNMIDDLEGMREHKLSKLNRLRLGNLKTILGKIDKKNPDTFYLRHEDWIERYLTDKPEGKITDIVGQLDGLLEEEKITFARLEVEVEQEVTELLVSEGIPDYVSESVLREVLRDSLKSSMSLTNEGLLNLRVKDYGKDERYNILKNRYIHEVVQQFIETDSRLMETSYAYGSRRGFIEYAKQRMSNSDKNTGYFIDREHLYKVLSIILGTYLGIKETEHEEHVRREEERREREAEEARERREQEARDALYISSSSSSNSSSDNSGGGFGGGFGGGSSGGGGASGGW